MPAADSTTSPEASAGKRASKGPIPLDRVDLSRDMLVAVTNAITEDTPENMAVAIEDNLDAFLNGLVPKPETTIPTDVRSNPKYAALWSQRTLAYGQAKFAFENSRETALTVMQAALGAWRAALRAYDFAVGQADVELRQARAVAVELYENSLKKDDQSKDSVFFFQMKSTIVTAGQAYTASAAAAADTLAGAAGALAAAAEAFADAVAAAVCQRAIDEAAADQALWQNYEAS